MDRRTKEYKELVHMTPTTQELLSEEIDGELYLYKYSPQCKICNTSEDLRNIIDSLLLFPKTYKEVLQSIQSLQDKLGIVGDDRINYENIRNHQKRHLPFDKAMVRETVERRAREKNRSILDTSERLLTAEAFYEVIVAKGWEEIAKGHTQPTLNQTMEAMERLQKLEKEGQEDYRPEELINQLDIILMAVREVLPSDMKEALFRKIEEFQTADKKHKNPQALREADIDIDDYVDEDLLEEDL